MCRYGRRRLAQRNPAVENKAIGCPGLNGKVGWAMRAEAHRPRRRRLGRPKAIGRARALAVSVPVLVSFFVWWSVLAVLPLWAAALVLAVVVASMGVALVPSAEPAVVRLLHRARRATGPEHQMLSRVTATLCGRGQGPPVAFYVGQVGAAVPAVAVGSRSVVVDRVLVDALVRGRLTPEQGATAIAPAAALVSAGATAADVAVLIWVLPWMVLRGVGTALLRACGLTALLRLGWRTRWVVVAVAVVQAIQASQPVWAGVLAALLALTYGWPRWITAWRARLAEVAASPAARRGAGISPETLAGAGPGRLQRAGSTAARTPSEIPPRAGDGRPRLTLVR